MSLSPSLTPEQEAEIQSAMDREMEDLERRSPETAEALREAEAKERRENDPIDRAEQQATAEAEAATPTPSRTLKTPIQKNPPSRQSQRNQRSRPSPGAASSADDAEPKTAGQAARQALEGMAEAGKRAAGRKSAPREDDWADFLAILFGFMSLLFVWWLVSDLVTPISMQERKELELTDDEAEALARPAARLLARSALNERYGQSVIGASDYIVMLVVLTAYAERVAPAVKRKVRGTPKTVESRPIRRTQGSAPPPPPAEEPSNPNPNPEPEVESERTADELAGQAPEREPFVIVRGAAGT